MPGPTLDGHRARGAAPECGGGWRSCAAIMRGNDHTGSCYKPKGRS